MVQQIFQEGFGIEEEKQPRLERLLYCLEKNRNGGTSSWRRIRWEAEQSRELRTHSWLLFLTTTLLELVYIPLCACTFACSTLQGPSLRKRQPLAAHKSSKPAPHNPALGLGLPDTQEYEQAECRDSRRAGCHRILLQHNLCELRYVSLRSNKSPAGKMQQMNPDDPVSQFSGVFFSTS